MLRARVLDPRWLDGLKRHGFRGGGVLARTVDLFLHWDAATGLVQDHTYEALARRFALDPATQDWLRDANPHALRTMTERFLEAEQRGLWVPEPDTRDRLEALFLDVEGDLEDGP